MDNDNFDDDIKKELIEGFRTRKKNLGVYKLDGVDCIFREKYLSIKKDQYGGKLYNIAAEHPKYGMFSVLAREKELL